jgi:serine phosphatase RsbU (regulator of sigma subunit)
MRIRTLIGLALAALSLAAAAPAPAQQPGVLRLPWNQWQMHIGDNPQCAQIDATGCALQPLVFEASSGRPNQWQRIEVTLPAELQSAPQLGLLIQGNYPVYEVFIDGHSIGGSGSLATRQGPQYSGKIFSFPSSLARQGHLVIVIHSLGILTAIRMNGFEPAIASLDRIEFVRNQDTLNYLSSSWLHYLCYTAMFGAGFVFLLLFSVNTRLHEYFWLGARLCTLPMFRLGELASVVDLSMPTWTAFAIYSICNATGALFSIQFIFSFLGRPVPKTFRAIQLLNGLYVVWALLLLPWPSSVFFPLAKIIESPYLYNAAMTGMLLSALSFLFLMPFCLKSKLPEMRWIGAAALLFAVEESNRMISRMGLASLTQDIYWHGLDIDLRGLSNLLFAIVMLIAMTFRLRRIQNRNREVEQEIAAARSVQQILIPDQLPTIPGLRIESAYLPAQEVGGDFFQILPLLNSADPQKPSAFIVLGDVSGKGLKAAMTVSLIVGTLRTYAEFCSSPAELLAGLNRRLQGRVDGFATCLALKIEPSGKLTLANAAHPNPYINGVEILTEPNLPLGISLDVAYSELTLQLDPDLACTLLTDGVVEAASAATHELFGFDRTKAISTQSASSIAEAARTFGLGAPQADDITVLTVARSVNPEQAIA